MGVNDLLPGDQVRIRLGKGKWSGQRGTVIWASDAHGPDRVYDVKFVRLPSTTFVATELDEVERSEVSAGRSAALSYDNEA